MVRDSPVGTRSSNALKIRWAQARAPGTSSRALEVSLTPKHIGIIACSAEGAALCYRTICVEGAALVGPHAHPEVSLHSQTLAEYVARIERDDWGGVGEMILISAAKLAGMGAQLLVCPDNTIHQAMPFIESRLPVPFLHIADVVAGEAEARGFRRVGLMGTRWLVDSDVYPSRLAARGIECVYPNAAERAELHRVIMAELVNAVFEPESLSTVQSVVGRMKADGADAVILGCTELPLILDASNAALPTLDSTRLLARAALHRAVKA